MTEAFLCEGVRTPVGRYGGALSSVRPDDLLAHAIKAVVAKAPGLDPHAIDDVYAGCANQAGEDNRNVARMAALLAGLPTTVPGTTINRLCGSGLDAIGTAARAVRAGEIEVAIAGGVESMSRAPFVQGKATEAFSRHAEIYDTTIGWRFVNPLMKAQYGVDSMPETGENVAEEFQISRADQDAFALRSQARAAAAQKNGRLAREIVARRNQGPQGQCHARRARRTSARDEPRQARRPADAVPQGRHGDGGQCVGRQRRRGRDHRRLRGRGEALWPEAARAHHRPRDGGRRAAHHGLWPRAGDGQADGAARAEDRRISASIELNEAFASQALAVLRGLHLPDDAEHVNPNGGAIAIGHPLGMSGARLALTAAIEMNDRDARRALATMCIGVGQGIALGLERA